MKTFKAIKTQLDEARKKAVKEAEIEKVWDDEEEAAKLKEEAYKEFFAKALDKFNVSSPSELKGDKKKEFYDYVDKNWKSDNEKSGLDEVLSQSDPIEDWIKDFVDSKNPKFAGKSKEERIKMAKGAYYAAAKK